MTEQEFLAEEILVCGLCPEDDNEWLASAFTMGGRGCLAQGGHMCNDCWKQRYAYHPCLSCQRSTRARKQVCADCKREAALKANGEIE